MDDALGEFVVVMGVWKTVSHELVAKGDELAVVETLGQKTREVGVVGDGWDGDEDGARRVEQLVVVLGDGCKDGRDGEVVEGGGWGRW